MEKDHDNKTVKNNLSSNASPNENKLVTSSSNLLSPENVFSSVTSSLAIEEAQKQDPNFNSNPLLLNNNLNLAEGSLAGGQTLDQTFSWHQVQAVADNTAVQNPTDAQIVAQKDDIAFNNERYEPLIPIKPFQDNFGNFEANKIYNTLDVANFQAPTSNKVHVFNEAAANNEVALELGTKTDLESLSDFDFFNVASDAMAPLTPLIYDDRRIQIDPNANPDFNTYVEGSPINPTGNVLINDNANGNVLKVSNPGTYQGFYGTLILNTDGTYTYIPKDPATNPEIREALNTQGDPKDVFIYSLDDGNTATLTIKIITVEATPVTPPVVTPPVTEPIPVTPTEPTPITPTPVEPTPVNPTPVDPTPAPIANPDKYHISENDLSTGKLVLSPTIIINDTDANPTAAANLTAIHVYDGVTSYEGYTAPAATLTLNSPNQPSETLNLVQVNPTVNPTALAEYTYYNPITGQTVTFDITKENQIEITNGTALSNLTNGQKIIFTASYSDSDGVSTSAPALITVEIDGVTQPPIAQPNSYEFYTDETYAKSESEDGSDKVVFKFPFNIINDAVDETKPSDAANPKDSDPQGLSLTVSRVEDITLSIAGKPVTLSVVETSNENAVSARSFEFQGHTGIVTQMKDGSVEFTSVDKQQLFYGVEVGQQVIYKSTNYVINSDNIESKVGASLTLTLDGTSVPIAQNDRAEVDDFTLVTNQTPTNNTFEIIDILSNDESPMMPKTKDDFRVVKVLLDNDASNSTGPKLIINGQEQALTISTTDDIPLHVSTTIKDKDVSFDLNAKGIVSVTNGAEAFSTITATDNVTLSFFYLMTDGVATSAEPKLVTIKFTNNGGVLTADLDTNAYLEGSTADVIGNVLANDKPNSEANPLKVLDLNNSNAKVQIIEGKYGELTLNQDGSYIYKPYDPNTNLETQKALNTPGPHQDVFEYTAVNKAGNTSDSTLTIDITTPPVVQLARYADTTQMGGAKSIPYNDYYKGFNTNSFPITQESVNISTIIDPNTNKPQDISQYLVNTIKLENSLEKLTLTFQGEGAGYRNTLGWYQINPKDGTISDVKLIWTNASAVNSDGDLIPGQTKADLGPVSKGTQIGFFLIADGYNKNVNIINQIMSDLNKGYGHLVFTTTESATGSVASISSTAPYLFYVPTNLEKAIVKTSVELTSATGSHTGIYHTAASPQNDFALNGDKLQHSIGSLVAKSTIDPITQEKIYSTDSASILVGFEDLEGPFGTKNKSGNIADRDGNDLRFELNLPIGATNYQQAGSNHINVDFTDIDGQNLKKAFVILDKYVDDPNKGNGDTLVINTNTSLIEKNVITISTTPESSGLYSGYYHVLNPGYDNIYIKGINTAFYNTNNSSYESNISEYNIDNVISATNTQIKVEIVGEDTHAHYQDVVNSLHIMNSSILVKPDDAAGTRYFSVQVYDEEGNASNVDNIPYIITKLTPVDTTDARGLEGNQYIHVTDPAITEKQIYGNNDDNIFEVTTANNTITAGNGNDQIIASGGGSTIYTNGGNDTVYTSGGGNKIYAGSGDDYINAGTGANEIHLGFGKAVIAFQDADVETSLSKGVDTIYNPIAAGSDNATVIDLSQILHNLGNYTPGVSDISKFVEIKEASDGKLMLEVNTTGNHADSKAIAILEGFSSENSVDVFDGNYHQAIAVTQGG